MPCSVSTSECTISSSWNSSIHGTYFPRLDWQIPTNGLAPMSCRTSKHLETTIELNFMKIFKRQNKFDFGEEEKVQPHIELWAKHRITGHPHRMVDDLKKVWIVSVPLLGCMDFRRFASITSVKFQKCIQDSCNSTSDCTSTKKHLSRKSIFEYAYVRSQMARDHEVQLLQFLECSPAYLE
jgi:hypothetical protein